jgi:predicted GTPase
MGHCGTGKTSIFNKICGTKHQAGWAEASLTRGIARHETSFGDNSFTVIDAPGDNSSVERRKHAILLKHSLTMEPVNAIFVIVEWHTRTSTMLDWYEETVSPLKE